MMKAENRKPFGQQQESKILFAQQNTLTRMIEREGTCHVCGVQFVYEIEALIVNGTPLITKAPQTVCHSDACKQKFHAEAEAATIAEQNRLAADRGSARARMLVEQLPRIYQNRVQPNHLIDDLKSWHAKQSLFLFGDVGCGKSHQLATLIAFYTEQMSVEWYSSRRLISDAMASISNKKLARPSILAFPTRPDILVLDDFGAERATEFAITEMGNLIDARYNAGRPVLITANYSLGGLVNRASDVSKNDDAPLVVEMDRITSRLSEMTRGRNGLRVKMLGTDRRVS